MSDDFAAALARVQTDYDFYVACQTTPGTALADYDLSVEERSVFTDPDRFAQLLRSDPRMLPRITVTISGSHDWVNRAAPEKKDESAGPIQDQVAAIQDADDEDERRDAALRLMRLL